MNEKDVFVLADLALDHVVQQIGDDQWEMAMPANFARRDGSTQSLREVINYHAFDDAWVPDMLAGRTIDEAGKDKFDGDLLGDEPRAAFTAIVDKACAAATELDDLDRTVHCSFGDYPAREYLWQINGFRGLRAWDIAQGDRRRAGSVRRPRPGSVGRAQPRRGCVARDRRLSAGDPGSG